MYRSLGILVRRGVRYLQAEVERIDTVNQQVHTSRGPLPYDYLVLALGAEYDWAAVPGAERAHSFYNIQTARRLRRSLEGFRGGRLVIAVSRLPYKCPPAPYEVALILDRVLAARGLRQQTDLHLFTPEPAPLRVVGPVASAAFRTFLARRGITLHTEENLKGVDSNGRRASFFSGESIDCNLLITVPVHRSPAAVREARLTDGTGWVPVDPRTLAIDHPNVYAMGDVTFLPMASGAPLPKAGVFARAQGEVVARNLAARIQSGAQAEFSGEGYCFVEQGGEKAALVTGNFLVEPAPQVALRPPSVRWHRAKVRFEQGWRRWRI